ncbi:PfkB family carbohydrate kinase, partial [Stecheria sp. CLA-KB-P133]|nr:PfkB family carbohydrate kinase [Stecheria sp. CLA-KB-P133]
MLSRLHRKTVFIGKVGNDGFGQMLARTVVEQGISDLGLRYDDKVHTTLALVLKLENGDRDFAFYRNPGADVVIIPELSEPSFRTFEASVPRRQGQSDSDSSFRWPRPPFRNTTA